MDVRVTRSSTRRTIPNTHSNIHAISSPRTSRRSNLITSEKSHLRSEKVHSHDSDKENAPPENAKNEITKTEETCGICLDAVKERGLLNSCNHAFCFECIFQWSKTSNTCPLCKARFVQLRKQEAGNKSKRSKSYKVEDVDHRQDDSDFDDWFSSDDDMEEWEELGTGQEDTWMYQDYDNTSLLIDLTESDQEDSDVEIDENEDDGEADSSSNNESDGSESAESYEESGSESDCYIINNVSSSDGEDFEDVSSLPLRRSSRLRGTQEIDLSDGDVDMKDGENNIHDNEADEDDKVDDSDGDSVSSRVVQRRRVAPTPRRTSLRSATQEATPGVTGRSTRNSSTTVVTPLQSRRTRTTQTRAATNVEGNGRTLRRSPRISRSMRM